VVILSSTDDAVTEVSLRAIRVVQTRLANVLGEVPTAESMKLLAMELSEVDDTLSLVSAVAAVAAVTVVLASQAQGIAPGEVFTQIRSVMTPSG
jgi:hypothetical protein